MLEWLQQDIVDRGRLPLLCCLVAFICTFFLTRTLVRYIRGHAGSGRTSKWWQPRNIRIGSLHIHHVVFGVVLVMVSGLTLVALAVDGHEPALATAATGFGIGAALVLDEYALILHFSDVYWEEDGRSSVDAVFAAVAVTGLLVLGFHPLTFLLSLWHDTSSPLIRAGVFAGLVMALPLAVVVVFKGKVWTGLSGMFFFPLLVIGAIRLSRPHAPWARWRYSKRHGRMRRALARERRLRRPVVQVKLWLQDRIAGGPGGPPTTPSTPSWTVRSVPRRHRAGRSGTARPERPRGKALRYFYDTEFIEDGRTIELISIGIVAEDGREYYGVSTEFDPGRAGRWVRTYVLPKLPPPASPLWRSRGQIRVDLETFLGVDGDDPIELWAWVGAYDHVVLCQLWGPMPDLPRAMPRFTRELRQLWEDRGCPPMPPRPPGTHDALVDAREQWRRFRVITTGDDAGRGAGR